ncbi:MAG: transcription-repair coupling factor, partial [Bacteroidota bacterium]|nr:transcription-repair coupling factor [Bacteroidota bacterium]
YIFADVEIQRERLEELLREPDQEDPHAPALPPGACRLEVCPLSAGFLLERSGFAVYTEHQVFNRRRVQRSTRKGRRGMSLRDFHRLKPGDYVVHVDKGIGKFAGLERITVNGGVQETVKVLYAENDVLYVNLAYINRLQRYTGGEGSAPQLTRLGSGEWERVRRKTRLRTKNIARDLIRLYAKRRLASGFAYSPDTVWQKELEASFLYEDTPDQLKATQDVKRDMESRVPMDRLICGDVGYGKTEIAIRAAFKAVLDGKQAAVLVPTTILAEQHFHTFRDRLSRYPVVIETLSRFKKRADQAAVLERLRSGAIDIIIGTHRLLSDDVTFRDLGLLIIDEEHRFGVAAKEKLRRMREHVDTMALTATPIPRTLNFSLHGARDFSIIETPPPNRLPILTSIISFDETVIREAIARELERGGQVYFVSDRIEGLERLADRLRSIVPGARLGIAHGRMTGSELERVMVRFLERRIDVLVTTKIVESGLDIPNANTIFINRAERFGLAELYQLRGRVGRSNIQAFAYLIVPDPGRLTGDAVKRLRAIEEFSELGSGFQLAMRDMEIRGAGNLLGAEQSGFIHAIGFDLYLATIEEAVAELKEEEFPELFPQVRPPSKARPDVVMELGIDAYLPQDYVEDSTERFDIYKRLALAEDNEAVESIGRELADRFGRLPQEAENLLSLVRMRILASRIRLTRVSLENRCLTLVFPPEEDATFYERHLPILVAWISAHKTRTTLEQRDRCIQLVIRGVGSQEETAAILRELAESCTKPAPGAGEGGEHALRS